MKAFFPLLFLFLVTTPLIGQGSQLEGGLKNFTEVDQAPVFDGCEEGPSSCTITAISEYLLDNFDKSILDSVSEEKITLILKFIIDTKGEIAWVRAQGEHEEVKQEMISLVKALPNFQPGIQKGERVNVLVDLPLRLNIESITKNTAETTADLYDTPAYFEKCRGEQSIRECTSKEIRDFVNGRMNLSRLDEGLHWAKLRFKITETGEIGEITATGSSEELKKRAIKLVRKLPDFIPATKDGKNIEITYQLPIYAKVNKN